MATIPGTLNTNLTDEQVLEAFDNALTHTPSDSTPKEDGSGSAGEAETFARSDHEHPHDTTKQDTVLGSWTPDTSATHQTPAGTDTVLEALQKIDRNQRADETNILNKQDKATASGERYNTTDTYARYITLTIPANRVCKVSAALSFSNSQPRGIAISQSSDSSTFDTNANLIGQKVETSTAVPQIIAEGYCSFSTDKTLYVWAKSASAASNSIFAVVEYLS